MKFLVDMPLSPALAAWLREQGHDAVHAMELGLDRANDVDILDRAKRDGRVVITADLDYPRLLALARATDPGLILFRDGAWSDLAVIGRLDEILRVLAPKEIESTILVIERDRIRRRRLPIES